MSNTDEKARRQTRLTGAIMKSVGGKKAEEARRLLESLIDHGEPWNEEEHLAAAILRAAMEDPDVLAAVLNAAQAHRMREELLAEGVQL